MNIVFIIKMDMQPHDIQNFQMHYTKFQMLPMELWCNLPCSEQLLLALLGAGIFSNRLSPMLADS